jgi:hypothetical protein
MAGVGIVLTLVYLTIVAIAFGLAVAAWGTPAPAGLRLARGSAVTIGLTVVTLAAVHPIAQILP